MQYFTLADVAVGPVLAVGGLLVGLVTLLLIVLVEAAVMALTGWGGFGRSFVDSLIANAVSGVLGIVLLAVLSLTPLFWLAFPLSFAIEGLTLQLLRRHGAGTTWRIALYANMASYALFFLAAWAMDAL